MCIIAVIIFASVRKIWVEDRKNFSVSDMSNVIIGINSCLCEKNEATVYNTNTLIIYICAVKKYTFVQRHRISIVQSGKLIDVYVKPNTF